MFMRAVYQEGYDFRWGIMETTMRKDIHTLFTGVMALLASCGAFAGTRLVTSIAGPNDLQLTGYYQLEAGSSLVVKSWISKPGDSFLQVSLYVNRGLTVIQKETNQSLIVVSGPGGVAFMASPSATNTSLLTVEITTPDPAFPADRTAMIPAGQGAQVNLECSTDLISWGAVLPGSFTNNPTAKFFRIHAEKVP